MSPDQAAAVAKNALGYTIRRLQANVDYGSRPDQWSMEDIIRQCKYAIASLDAAQAPRDVPRLTDAQMRAVLQETAEGLDSMDIVMTHWPQVARAVESRVRELCGVAP